MNDTQPPKLSGSTATTIPVGSRGPSVFIAGGVNGVHLVAQLESLQQPQDLSSGSWLWPSNSPTACQHLHRRWVGVKLKSLAALLIGSSVKEMAKPRGETQGEVFLDSIYPSYL